MNYLEYTIDKSNVGSHGNGEDEIENSRFDTRTNWSVRLATPDA